MAVAGAVYRLTRNYPRDEQFGQTSQTRRAAVSMPANVAGGHGRDPRPSYAAFLRIARGSLKDLETHLLLAEQVGIAPAAEIAPIWSETDEIGRMLNGPIRVSAVARS